MSNIPEQPTAAQYPPARTRLERIAEYIRSTGRTTDTLEIFTRDWIDVPATRYVIRINAITQILEVDGVLIPTLEQFTNPWLDEVRQARDAGRAKRIEGAA